MNFQRRLPVFLVCIAASTLAGCHSAFINAHIVNDTGGAVSEVEVDYPSASFGKDRMTAGATYDYRFKVLGSGPVKVEWLNGKGQQQTITAGHLTLSEGDEGALDVVLHMTGAEINFRSIHGR